ncbi:hypothetical protein [Streptacidiphilus sp. PAMC 29251]
MSRVVPIIVAARSSSASLAWVRSRVRCCSRESVISSTMPTIPITRPSCSNRWYAPCQ